MEPQIKYFKNKLKEGYWSEGNSWEFDWYIDCFFCEAMYFGKTPVNIKYNQPILGDTYLSLTPKEDERVLDKARNILKNSKLRNDFLRKQEIILNSAQEIIDKFKNKKEFKKKEYKKIQLDLSLLMASVSIGFDPVMGEILSEISVLEKISLNKLFDLVVGKSSVSALNESNKRLLDLYKKYRKEIDETSWQWKKLEGKIKKQLEIHAYKYGWINTGERGGDSWNGKDFFTQIKKIKDIKKIETQGKIKISLKNKILLNTIIEINKNDNLAADMQVQLDYLFQEYLKDEMGDLYDESIIENLTYDEIINLIARPYEIKKYLNRRHNYNRVVFVHNNKIYSYYFDTLKEYDLVKMLVKRKEMSGVVHGTPACLGKVEGIVKIVSTKNDLYKIKEGDVLVAVKTQPSYVVAMTKAAAIVTDVGGITSHAAIIAREFDIPCIVATGNATKKLFDGEKVLVDAESGRVEKL